MLQFRQISLATKWIVSFFVLCLCFSEGRGDNIAFFYALDADFAAFRKAADGMGQTIKLGSRTISLITIGDHKVYAIKMGAGCVETAASAQALLTKFRCDYAVSVGTVGALSSQRKIGEWAPVAKVTAYQRGTESSAGFQLASTATPKIPSLENPEQFWTSKEVQKNPPLHVASGEVFCASSAFRAKVAADTGADAIDMNLFGLVTVCLDSDIPMINWRVVSDNADEQAAEKFAEFVKNYNGEGGTWVAEFIRRLPKNPNHPNFYDNLKSLLEKKEEGTPERPLAP